jgi:YggT family protein
VTTIGLLLLRIIQVYFYVLLARAIFSWLPLLFEDFRPRGWLVVIMEAVYTLTDPPLKALGRFIRPVRLGGMGIDIAFIVLVALLYVVQRVVIAVFC